MLALRLGLLPIKTDLSSYQLPQSEEEVAEKSARCTLQLRLKANKKGYVYAEDATSSDPKCTFVQGKMPVVKLLAKQKVDVTLTAVMGQGKNHIKWSPGWPWYKKEAELKVGKVENPALLAENCPDGVFTIKGSSVTLNKDKLVESNLVEYYAELDSGISLQYTDNIIFNLESFGQLSCKKMLEVAADMLAGKAKEMEALL